MNLLIFSDELEALKDCTFILEAVSEDPDVKREVYAKIASICRPDTIFCIVYVFHGRGPTRS